MQSLYPARRREFLSDEGLEALERIRVGALATVDEQGECEVRPMNFVLWEGAVYLHTSPDSALARRGRGTLTGWCDEAWIPSYWRHPKQACPATTYYTSVVARGALGVVEDLNEKAAVLQAFMHKYQSEGGYVELDAQDPLYRGPLAALCVLRMELEDLCCKRKYGQHLTPSARQRVLQGLVDRGDWRTSQRMRQNNQDLAWVEGFCGDGGAMSGEAIWTLLRDTYWAHKRSPEGVEQSRRTALAQWGFFEGGQLRAYARVEGFWLSDVVVADGWRGRGIGTGLLQRLLADPKVRGLARVGLDTRDAEEFYQRLGFVRVGRGPTGSWMMVRLSSAEG